MRNVILTLMLLFTFKVNSQVVTIVQYEYQADIKIYLCDYKYMADVVVYKTRNKHDANNKQGYWYWGGSNTDNTSKTNVNVYLVDYKYQSDYSIYFTNNIYDIRLTTSYLTDISK